MGMNLIAAVTLLPITILTDSYFSPSLPLKTVDYAVIGLGLITVVGLYDVCIVCCAFWVCFFQSSWIYRHPYRCVLGNDHLRREPVCLDLAFALCP